VSRRVLVVDDEELIRKSLCSVLADRGYEAEAAETGAAARERFAAGAPHIVILDLRLPDCDGVDLLKEFREGDETVRVIMITAHGDVRKAVEAMKLGAVDFLRKPYELDEILLAVEHASQNLDRDRRLNLYEERDRATLSRQAIIGRSLEMQRVWVTVEKVAESDTTTVLLEGESGTGKELFARAIHHLSARSSAPIVGVNCSSFQENLLENELFGHEKGAFTGATQLKRGLVEVCDGGTLFLDEVSEMPLLTQSKLLRFIDNQTFRRVGGGTDVKVDLRIVAATNASLESAVARGAFRKDLFYRLKVVAIILPPLRERGDDLLYLTRHFLESFSRKFRKRFRDVEPRVLEVLKRHEWPGNVRELKNLIERVVLLEDGPILTIDHLPDEIRGAFAESETDVEEHTDADAVDLGLMTLREAADRHILRVLDACEGNRSRAARVLNISRQHLINRLKELNRKTVSMPATIRSLGTDG
jgi:DNA-binding NtrC family response regulator